MKDIVYGIRKVDGKVLCIEEIPTSMSGLSCGCKCASCGVDLQACSLDGKVSRYFRHDYGRMDAYDNQKVVDRNCNPNTANETALHLLAKQIVLDEKRVWVPDKTISLSEAGIGDLPEHISNSVSPYVLRNECLIEAEYVELEKHIADFKPDIYIKTSRGELLIEIYVSHRVDEEKRQKAEMYGAAMLEIDLGEYVDASITTEILRDIVVNSKDNKSWKNYPVSKSNLMDAQKYYMNLPDIKNYFAKIAMEKNKEQRELQDKERRNKKIINMFEPEKYAAELRRLRSDISFWNFCSENKKTYWYDFGKHYQDTQSVPFFIDIPITGEMVFQCDRRIWQSIIFNRFIYCRKEDNASFNAKTLFEVLKDEHNIKVDYDLTYKLAHPLYTDWEMQFRNEVVKRYIYYLALLGFVWEDDNNAEWRKVRARKTIIPPERNVADKLLSIIETVDRFTPNIDTIIDEALRKYFAEMLAKEEGTQRAAHPTTTYHWTADQIKQYQAKNQMVVFHTELSQQDLKKVKQDDEQKIYEIGLREMSSVDFTNGRARYDKFNNKWIKCETCLSLKRDYEMAFYCGGLGTCKQCSYKLN